jgi:hypothetical protein
MLFFKSPELKIHCWGGLGSQLLALNYYLKILQKFPTRKVILVLHNGGVTMRNSELDFLAQRINLRKVQDFDSKSNFTGNSRKFSYLETIQVFIKLVIKKILNKLYLVITDDSRVTKVKFWTISIRCTFNKVSLTKQDVISLSSILEISEKKFRDSSIGVHYRLGDLLTLKPESLISPEAISKVIHILLRLNPNIENLIVYSDSKLGDKFIEIPNSVEIKRESIATLQTISDLIEFNYFIGTNSKVSLWVAIFRWGLDISGEIYLPQDIFSQFKILTKFESGTTYNFILKSY